MDQELKAKWVAALRSGKYEQGQKHLRANGKFCCLGVLADLVDPSRWAEVGLRWRWSGTQGLPKILPTTTELFLVGMNDEGGKSFDEIADYIEEKP